MSTAGAPAVVRSAPGATRNGVGTTYKTTIALNQVRGCAMPKAQDKTIKELCKTVKILQMAIRNHAIAISELQKEPKT